MALGASVHWSTALEELTGESTLNATALLEYFEPLHRFLREANGEETAVNDLLDAREAGAISTAAATANTATATATILLLLMPLILNR